MKKLLLGVGSIASVIAPIASVVSCSAEPQVIDSLTDQKDLYKTTRQTQNVDYVYQWGPPGLTIDHPNKETLAAFIARHPNLRYPTEEAAVAYLIAYSNTHDVRLKFFVGTEAEFEQHKIERPIHEKADKGQLALDLVILVSQIKTYVTDKIFSYQWQINDNQWKFTDELLEFHLGLKTEADLRSAVGAVTYRNLISHTWQPKLSLWKGYLKSIRRYFTDLTTLINGGLTAIMPVEIDTMVAVLEEMKTNEASEYQKLHTIIGLDEIIEPQEFANEMELILHMVEQNAVVSPTTQQQVWLPDPNAHPGGSESLAGQIANAGGTV